jgi:hypothetical protein
MTKEGRAGLMMVVFASPTNSTVMIPELEGTPTWALPPIRADDVGTNVTPTAGVTLAGSPTAWNWAGVAVPNEAITCTAPEVVEVEREVIGLTNPACPAK